MNGFNTQPPEGGCFGQNLHCLTFRVSTRSRPKAAGPPVPECRAEIGVSTRSRPKAADAGCFNKRAAMWFQHAAARRRLRNSALHNGVA